MTHLALGLTAVMTMACSPGTGRAPATEPAERESSLLDPFQDGSYDLGTSAVGNPFDARFGRERFLALQPRLKGPIPPPDVVLDSPAVVVSLSGLTCRLYDRTGSFEEVYPVGVGVRSASTGLSITPVGTFYTARDRSDRWYYIWQRQVPAYFGGLPFLRIDAENKDGLHTYGLHGPITDPLKRGYVSHGCVRMRGQDIQTLFKVVYAHGRTPVTIQQAVDRDRQGRPVEIDYSRLSR